MSRSLAAALLTLCCVFGEINSFADDAKALPEPVRLGVNALEQVFKIDANLYSGSSPTDDAGFQILAILGVKTIISVDGTKPSVELAHKYGMRYVHLPIGYDGVPAERAAELVKAASTANGRIYVHCHHGKHRGPAAVAVICRGLKDWSEDDAGNWLVQAGTGAEYPGLHRDARAFQKPSADALAAMPSRFPEVAKTAETVDHMVAIDEYFDRLKAADKAGWPKGLEANGTREAATLLHEGLREFGRLAESTKHGADFVALLSASEEKSAKLRDILRADPIDSKTATTALNAMSASCTDCHRKHRN